MGSLRFETLSPLVGAMSGSAAHEFAAGSPDLAEIEKALDDAPGLVRRDLRLACDDGTELAASWVEPCGDVRAVAVINSATGVGRGYYRVFSEWLALRGYAALTYDYRGIGDSRHGDVRASTATMLEWARQDIPAAIRAGAARGKPLLVIGHSSGGNLLLLVPEHAVATATLVVGSQLGDRRNWDGLQRLVIGAAFRVMIPALNAALGHLPAWAMGGGTAQPLPPGVASQWARWGCTPGYYFGAPETRGLLCPEAYAGPYHAYSISDDAYAPPRAVAALAASHVAARTTVFSVEPAAHGVKRIGHFGVFRRRIGERLWPAWLARIESEAPALRGETGNAR